MYIHEFKKKLKMQWGLNPLFSPWVCQCSLEILQ